jgi:hypothetical protein
MLRIAREGGVRDTTTPTPPRAGGQGAHVEQFFQFYETAKAAQDTHMASADFSAASRGINTKVQEAFQS